MVCVYLARIKPNITFYDSVFPGRSVVKNPPTRAGDLGLIPGLGRVYMQQSNKARVAQLLSLCPRAWELQLLKPTSLTSKARAP